MRIKQIAILPSLPDGWSYHEIQERRDFVHGTTHWFVRLYTPSKACEINATGDHQDLADAIDEAMQKIPTEE
jgi:ribosome-associated translation inhibitor RaiA